MNRFTSTVQALLGQTIGNSQYSTGVLQGVQIETVDVKTFTFTSIFLQYIIILHFISLEPAFWATLPLYSTVDCTVGGSKESRGVQSHCTTILLLLAVAMLVHLHHGLLSVLSAWKSVAWLPLVLQAAVLASGCCSRCPSGTVVVSCWSGSCALIAGACAMRRC